MQPLALYLQRRGLELEQRPDDLAYHPHCYNFTTEKRHSAMVAAIRNCEGEIIAVHQTFLTPDGQKVAGDDIESKLVTGARKGGAIRLAPASNRLALCEGIEDALTIIQTTDWPCWAFICAGNVPELPASIREVLICADNDAAGLESVKRLSRIYMSEGRCVRVAYPPKPHKDFNEALMAQKEKAA
jgi:putative DNA primase/helicase